MSDIKAIPITYRSRHLIDGKEWLKEIPPPVYSCEPILVSGQISSLTAPTNHGKSALASFLIAGFLKGGRIGPLNFKKCKVLALLGENDVNAAYQIKATAIKYRVSEDELENLQVFRIGLPIQDAYQMILGEIRSRNLGPFGFVSIDTSAAYFGGSDENNNTEARSHAAAMRKFTGEALGNPTVLVNCHPIKSADSKNLMPRGGGAFVNELDNNLTLWNDGGVIELAHSKLRMPPFDPATFLLDEQEIQFSDNSSMAIKVAKWLTEDECSNLAKVQLKDSDAIMEAVKSDGTMSLSKMAEYCGWINSDGTPNKSRSRRALMNAEKMGKVSLKSGVWRIDD